MGGNNTNKQPAGKSSTQKIVDALFFFAEEKKETKSPTMNLLGGMGVGGFNSPFNASQQ